MKSNTKLGVVISFIAFLSVGCGQGYQTASISNNAGDAANGSTSIDVSIDEEMRKAAEASKAAEMAMSEAQAVINEISDSNGNINVGLFSKSQTTVMGKGILSGVTDKLRAAFDKVFVKVTTVKAQFQTAKSALTEALAKLDQNLPEHSDKIQQIMAQLAKIDGLEAQFRSNIHKLAGKLDLAITGLDSLISGATSFIPGFGWVVDLALDFLVMGDVKAFIREIQMRLLAV